MPFFSAFLQAKIAKIKNKKIIGKIVHIVSEEKLWRPWRETNLIKLYKQGGKLMENNLMQELAAELNPREVNLKELNLQAESNDANENDAEGSVKKQPYVYRNAFEVTGKVISFNHDHMGHDMMTVLVKKQTPLFVRVIYDERMLPGDVVVGQHVHVKGYTKAFSYTDLAGKRTYMQFFSATSIEHRKTIMEAAMRAQEEEKARAAAEKEAPTKEPDFIDQKIAEAQTITSKETIEQLQDMADRNLKPGEEVKAEVNGHEVSFEKNEHGNTILKIDGRNSNPKKVAERIGANAMALKTQMTQKMEPSKAIGKDR